MLIKLIATTFFVAFSTTLFGDTTKLKNKDSIVIILDTLRVTSAEPAKKPNEVSSIPWMVALVIGMATVVVNIYIANRNRKVSEKQIDNSKDIAVQQINNSKELAIIDFDKTLRSKNRQDWITDLRKILSEFVSHLYSLNIEIDEKKDAVKYKELLERVNYNKANLLLLLDDSDSKPLQNELINCINEIMKLLDKKFFDSGRQTDLNYQFEKTLEAIIANGRKVTTSEWEILKNIHVD